MGMKTRRIWRLYLFGVTMLITINVACGGHSAMPPIDVHIETLAAQSETIYFVDKSALGVNGNNILSLMTWPASALVGALENAGLGAQFNGNIEYIMLGATNFRSPKKLGPVLWDGCYIIRLSSARDFDLGRLVGHDAVSEVNEKPVWNWTVQVEDDFWQYFIMQPSSSDIYVATNLEFLKSITKSAAHKQLFHKNNISNVEWKEVDRTKSIWAVRQYRFETKDPQAAGLWLGEGINVGPNAIALTFSFDYERRLATVRYLSSDGEEGALSIYDNEQGIETRKISPTTWESVISIGSPKLAANHLFILIGLFGFGIYL